MNPAVWVERHGRRLPNAPAIADGEPVRAQLAVANVNRTVGTMLGAEVTRAWGGQGLPEGTIDLLFTGSAGP